MAEPTKHKNCRNCGKACEVDAGGMYVCEECGWDEGAHVRQVRSRRLEKQIEQELDEEDKKKQRKTRGW